MAVEPASGSKPTDSSSNTFTPEEEQAIGDALIGEALVGTLLISNMDMRQRFKGMKIDHDLWRPGPGEPGAEDHVPITPLKL